MYLLYDIYRYLHLSPDDNGGGGGKEENNEESDDNSDDSEEDPYDKERAMRLITKLRTEIAGLKSTSSEAKALKKRVEELELAGKSELEKAQAKANSAEKDLADISSKTQSQVSTFKNRLVKMAIRTEAIKQGADDDLVSALIGMDTVEWTDPTDDDPVGEPTNIEKLVKDWIKKKPALLVSSSNQNGDKKSGPGATSKSNNDFSPSESDRRSVDRRYASNY